MFNSLSRPVAVTFLLALVLPVTVLAQTEDTAGLTADLHGVVLDKSGQPAAGYPMKLMTPQWGEVVMKPTDGDGTFGATGLPPGSYEFRVFEPGGSADQPIASKQVTVAAGQKEQLEIRLGPGNKSAAGGPATGTTLGTTGVSWMAVAIPVLVLAAGLVAFFALRAREKAGI